MKVKSAKNGTPLTLYLKFILLTLSYKNNSFNFQNLSILHTCKDKKYKKYLIIIFLLKKKNNNKKDIKTQVKDINM